MKNWKTTVFGLLAGAGQIFEMVGLPKELGDATSVIGLFLMGVFAKDSNVTGGMIKQ
jgi:mannose/fructose/N-acetylgalactosamine-specific phosphotransferase system component IID